MMEDLTILWIRIAYSLLSGLFFVELLEWRVTEKSSWQIKTLIIAVGWALVEIVLELEIYFLQEVNARVNYNVVGIPEYAYWFFLTVAIIEETVKFIAMGISIKIFGHKKMYPTVGIAGAFAGWETYIYVENSYTFDQAKALVDFRFQAGSQTVHLLMAFLFLTTVMIVKDRKWWLRWSSYLALYVGAIYIHLYFNYWTMLAIFGYNDAERAKFFIWGLSVIGFTIWAYVYGREVKYPLLESDEVKYEIDLETKKVKVERNVELSPNYKNN